MVSSFFTRACALAFVAVLGGALVANAAPINVSIVDTNPADAGYSSLPVVNGQHILGTLTATQTVNVGNSGEDRWVIALSSFNGDAAGTTMSGMQGTFTPGTGGSIYVGTGANEFGNGNWPIETASGHGGESYTSFIEFDSTISGTINSSTGLFYKNSVLQFSRTGSWDSSSNQEWTNTASANLLGDWYTANTPLSGTNNLAIIYVTTGANSAVSYSGQLSMAYDGGTVPSVSFSTAVPEPSSLALLVSGLIGLAAYAWKKRK